MPKLCNNMPAQFKAALQSCVNFLDENPQNSRILSLNAWNEWTESSYLEPDTQHGTAYLDAIREVFGM